MKNAFYLLFSLAVFAMACNNAPKNTDMADFADDPEFKEAHESPRSANVSGAGTMIQIPIAEGAEPGQAYALMAENSNKYLLVIHEWWGLNDNIKEEAERLFAELEDVNVLALDLYDGKVATNPDDAGAFMQAVSADRAKSIVAGAIQMAGPEADIATIGWCFGGGWSLQASILAGEQGVACVLYYGMPVQRADEIAPLQADILGIFAEQDGWITPEVAQNFEELAKATGKNIEIQQFDAAHAFANPSSEAYNEEAAQEANKRALEFLKERI
jgi:carboxymethylenebutenolidase